VFEYELDQPMSPKDSQRKLFAFRRQFTCLMSGNFQQITPSDFYWARGRNFDENKL